MLRLSGERLVVFSHCFLRREQGKGTSSVKRALGVMLGELMGEEGNEGE